MKENNTMVEAMKMVNEVEELWTGIKYNGENIPEYEISNLGRLRTAETGRIRKLELGNTGYCRSILHLGKSKPAKHVLIHKCVLESFSGRSADLERNQVNHISGCKTDNKLSNLEWNSPKENVRHAVDNGLTSSKVGADNGNSKLTKEDVLYIRANYKLRDKTFGAIALAEKFGVNNRSINNIVNNKSWINI